MKRQYWWAEKDPAVIVRKLENAHQSWSSYGSNPFAQAWWRNLVAYYSTVLESDHWESSLGYKGEQGELIKMSVPLARTLIRQMVTLVTKQRLSFTAIAETNESDVSKDLKIANAKIKEIITDQSLDQLAEDVAEQASVFGMAFLKVGYRTDKGEPYMASQSMSEDGEAVNRVEYDGKIEVTAPNVFDVSFDARIKNFNDNSWVEIRTMKNRYDLIAQHPELEVAILQLPPVTWYNNSFATTGSTELDTEDLVFVWEAYHKPSPAIPEGRMVMYSSTDTIYHDGINRYGRLPIVCIKPEPVHGVGYGYPHLSSLLPSQEMFDHALSAIATNQSALAVQNVLIPRGAEINVQDLGGMNALFYTPQNAEGGGKPEALQLTQSAPETFKFADYLKNTMTSLSNLNSTIRGEPPAGLTSGTAIATMSANALEFMSSLSKSLDLALEDSIYMSLEFERKFTVVPKNITMIGRNNKSSTVSYTGKNLDIIKKIKINRSNPLMASLAGRTDVAEKLLQTGLIKDPQMYFSIIEGAPLDVLFETELSENDLSESENEALMSGQEILALWTDDHASHIRKHSSLLNDPIIRVQSDRVEAVMRHIQEHSDLARNTDPFLTAMVRTGKMPQGGAPQQAAPDMGGMTAPGEPANGAAEPTEDQLGRV